MQPPRPAPWTLLAGRERTPQRLARIPLPPPLRWVHPHPRSSPSISCRVHNWLSTQYDYQSKCTTREKIFTYRLDRTTVTVGVPRILAMSTSPASAGTSSWASVAAGSSVTTAAGSVPPSATGGWRVSCATSSSTVGAGLRPPPAGSPTVSQSPSPPYSTGSEGGIS
jgi:hypothetical protein